MKNKWNRAIAAVWIPVLLLILIAQLVGCQSAPPPPETGPGANQPVKISSETPKASPTSSASPEPTEDAGGPIIEPTFKPKSSKDPFVPVVGPTNQPVAPETPTPETGAPPPTPVETKKPTQPAPSTPKPKTTVDVSETDAKVSVSAIMTSSSGNTAILKGESGASYVVKVGEKVGEWTVSSIDAKTVTLVSKKKGITYRAKLTIKSDLVPATKGGSGKPSGGEGLKEVPGPKVPEAPSGEAPPPPPPR